MPACLRMVCIPAGWLHSMMHCRGAVDRFGTALCRCDRDLTGSFLSITACKPPVRLADWIRSPALWKQSTTMSTALVATEQPPDPCHTDFI